MKYNFNKEFDYPRLVKFRKEDLDYGDVINEVPGDTLFEGRHGNSLRIGSRSNNPYVFISNKRSPSNIVESLGDGSIISITSNGTLAQHFGGYIKPGTEAELGVENPDFDSEENVIGFTLASDTLEEPNIYMGDVVSSVNDNQDVQELIYDYSENQMLFHSDRITLNSKLDDIYLSSI